MTTVRSRRAGWSLRALVLAVVAVVSLAGAAGVGAAQASVEIAGFRFTPAALTVLVGDTVTWTNADPAPHTATADSGRFDSEILGNGQQYALAPSSPGVFTYHCEIHPGMTGTLVVAAATLPSFPDVPPDDPGYEAIRQLAARDIIRGYQDGRFGPDDLVLRAQMAALIARAIGADWENHATPFPDRGGVDDNLWRNVGTLAFYDIARGYPDGKYRPLDDVLYAQVVSFITRGMVARGYWQQRADDPTVYPNVPASSGHRADIATFVAHAGLLPGTSSATEDWAVWDQPATRRWFVQAEWQAFASYFQ